MANPFYSEGRWGNPKRGRQLLDRLMDDQLSVPEKVLGTAGAFGGAAGDFMAYPIDLLMPNSAKEAIGKGMQWLADTDIGQGALQWAEDNPRPAQAIGDALDMFNFIPARAATTSGLNNTLLNTPTMVNAGSIGRASDALAKKYPGYPLDEGAFGFYSNIPGMGPFSGMTEMAEAVPHAALQSMNPKALAYARATGVTPRRAQELLETDKLNMAYGTSAAGELMKRQQQPNIGPRDEFMVKGTEPLNARQYTAVGLNFNDKASVSKEVFSPDIPQEVMDVHFDGMKNAWKAKGDNLEVVVKNPSFNNAGIEALGKQGNPAVSYLQSAPGLKFIQGGSKRDLIEATQVSNSFNPKLYHKMARHMQKTMGTESKDMRGSLVTVVLSARANLRKGKKLTEKQQVALDYWNEHATVPTIKDSKGTVVSSKDYNKIQEGEGMYHFGASHRSPQKEIGGVNNRVSIDPDKRKVYSTISDEHDMFGQIPQGGHRLFTIIPTQVLDLDAPKVTLSKQQPLGTAKDVLPQVKENLSVQPKPELQDYSKAAKNVGLFSAALTEEDYQR